MKNALPADEAVPLSPEALIALLEQLEIPVLRVDPVTLDVRPCGPRAQALLGCPAEVSGRELWGARVPGEEQDRVVATFRSVAADGLPRSVQHRLVFERGERHFRTAVRRVELDGRAQLLVALQDTTAPHHNEQQWREVQAWLVTLGQTLPFDFWICDREGRCVLQNPVSERHVGNLLGRPLEEAMEPASREQWRRGFQSALQGFSVREELNVEGKTFSRVVAPVREAGEISGVLGLDIDITELKSTEAQLRSSLGELSRAQDSLVRRSQLAALGEMAAVVAHEVRNPLGSISNALALLRRTLQGVEVGHPMWQVLEDEVQRLDALVVNLLDFVRPMSAVLTPQCIGVVLEESLTQTLRQGGAVERIRVLRHEEPGLRPVLMDVRLMAMALANLFRNAVQAMPGGGEIHVRIEAQLREGRPDMARVTIRDSGPGIPEEVRSRIFEPFVTTRPTGNGLGLSIVRRVIEEHHGELELFSEPGRGTTCLICLPMVDRA